MPIKQRSPHTAKRPRGGSPAHREGSSRPAACASQLPRKHRVPRRVTPCRPPHPPGRGTVPTGEGVESCGLVLVGVTVGGVADDQTCLAHGSIAHQHTLDGQLRAATATPRVAVPPQGGRVVQELLGRHGTGTRGSAQGAARRDRCHAQAGGRLSSPTCLSPLLPATPAACRPKPIAISLAPPPGGRCGLASSSRHRLAGESPGAAASPSPPRRAPSSACSEGFGGTRVPHHTPFCARTAESLSPRHPRFFSKEALLIRLFPLTSSPTWSVSDFCHDRDKINSAGRYYEGQQKTNYRNTSHYLIM